MPVSKVKVNEYQCNRCRYKWINRVNGKERSFPKKCAKCKRSNWNRDIMSPKEHGLRRRISGLQKLYFNISFWIGFKDDFAWSSELVEEFLNLKPRPTISELEHVINPPALGIPYLTSQNDFIRQAVYLGYVHDPENPGQVRFDKPEYIKIVKQGAQNRREIMREIIKSRQD